MDVKVSKLLNEQITKDLYKTAKRPSLVLWISLTKG